MPLSLSGNFIIRIRTCGVGLFCAHVSCVFPWVLVCVDCLCIVSGRVFVSAMCTCLRATECVCARLCGVYKRVECVCVFKRTYVSSVCVYV